MPLALYFYRMTSAVKEGLYTFITETLQTERTGQMRCARIRSQTTKPISLFIQDVASHLFPENNTSYLTNKFNLSGTDVRNFYSNIAHQFEDLIDMYSMSDHFEFKSKRKTKQAFSSPSCSFLSEKKLFFLVLWTTPVMLWVTFSGVCGKGILATWQNSLPPKLQILGFVTPLTTNFHH